jgi:tetratricopeptide (TPR) repeat protein
MSNLRGFKQKVSTVFDLWEEEDYDRALAEVESLLKVWPGNAPLHILWASLVQLQEEPKHDLDEARRALQQAAELDKESPAAAVELGHFLDNVDNDPKAASRAYAEGIAAARKLLIEGLIGQAKALLQLDKREASLRCLLEVLQLARFEAGSKRHKTEKSGEDIIVELPTGRVYALQLKGPHAEAIHELLTEFVTHRSA